MYVERIPNRNSPPAVLLRESYREGDKISREDILAHAYATVSTPD